MVSMAERPVECGNCKKPIYVTYKEIIGETVTVTEMCSECPVLKEKLYGSNPTPTSSEGKPIETGISCVNCRTPLDSVLMGNPLGCTECYEVYGDLLIKELAHGGQIPARTKKILEQKKNEPLHLGKTPTQPAQITPSNQLKALNEALNEALKKENYEQAAWLRDQIKALTGKANDRKN